jgi:hypothetical protein
VKIPAWIKWTSIVVAGVDVYLLLSSPDTATREHSGNPGAGLSAFSTTQEKTPANTQVNTKSATIITLEPPTAPRDQTGVWTNLTVNLPLDRAARISDMLKPDLSPAEPMIRAFQLSATQVTLLTPLIQRYCGMINQLEKAVGEVKKMRDGESCLVIKHDSEIFRLEEKLSREAESILDRERAVALSRLIMAPLSGFARQGGSTELALVEFHQGSGTGYNFQVRFVGPDSRTMYSYELPIQQGGIVLSAESTRFQPIWDKFFIRH